MQRLSAIVLWTDISMGTGALLHVGEFVQASNIVEVSDG